MIVDSSAKPGTERHEPMKRLSLVLVLSAVACEDGPPPFNAPLRSSAATSAAPPPKPSSPPSAAASSVPVVPREEPIDASELIGTWIHAAHGDAIPKGPTGGKIVDQGVRVIFEQRPTSKTPFNLKFWAPRSGHRTSATISGGCGFYPREPDSKTMTAFCRGYGLEPTENAFQTTMRVVRSGAVVLMDIEGVLSAPLQESADGG